MWTSAIASSSSVAGPAGRSRPTACSALYGDQRRDRGRRSRRPPRLPAGPAVRALRARPTRTRSSARAERSCTTGSSSASPRSTASTPPPTRSISPTATSIAYDVLVVAIGRLAAARGDRGADRARAGARRSSPSTTLEGATALRDALRHFDGGRLVVNVVDMPIKCPVAPLEFCFLADWYLRERGVRDDVELTYVTPLDGAFTKPVAVEHLAGLLGEKGIELVTEFNDRRGRRRRPGGSSATTSARSPSTCWSRSRCTAAPRTSGARPASATSSASSRPTRTRCSRRSPRTSSRSATPPTCRPRRPAR